jgi:hypothetical protein
MIRIIFALFLLLYSINVKSQELFVYTEPASNMPTHSLGMRLGSSIMTERNPQHNSFMITPELMYGISRNLMVHVEGILTDFNKRTELNGGALYMKYRFYSNDEVHSHFRLAAYGRAAINKNPIHQQAIDLNGFNSGYELGLVGTKLINKVAVSTGTSFVHAGDNAGNKFIYGDNNRNALSYNLSVGKLFLPAEYTDYRQLNVNGMIEALCQTNLNSGKTYIDLAPSVQFIILSKMRVDLGYRFPLKNDLSRTMPRTFLVRLEYNIFNAFR